MEMFLFLTKCWYHCDSSITIQPPPMGNMGLIFPSFFHTLPPVFTTGPEVDQTFPKLVNIFPRIDSILGDLFFIRWPPGFEEYLPVYPSSFVLGKTFISTLVFFFMTVAPADEDSPNTMRYRLINTIFICGNDNLTFTYMLIIPHWLKQYCCIKCHLFLHSNLINPYQAYLTMLSNMLTVVANFAETTTPRRDLIPLYTLYTCVSDCHICPTAGRDGIFYYPPEDGYATSVSYWRNLLYVVRSSRRCRSNSFETKFHLMST